MKIPSPTGSIRKRLVERHRLHEARRCRGCSPDPVTLTLGCFAADAVIGVEAADHFRAFIRTATQLPKLTVNEFLRAGRAE